MKRSCLCPSHVTLEREWKGMWKISVPALRSLSFKHVSFGERERERAAMVIPLSLACHVHWRKRHASKIKDSSAGSRSISLFPTKTPVGKEKIKDLNLAHIPVLFLTSQQLLCGRLRFHSGEPSMLAREWRTEVTNLFSVLFNQKLYVWWIEK